MLHTEKKSVFDSTINIVKQHCGPEAAAMVSEYLNAKDIKSILEYSNNSGGSECWVNTAEYEMLKTDSGRVKLAKFISNLAKEGYLTKDLFSSPDPKPDYENGLPQRKGMALALDLASVKKYGVLKGADDATVKRFEKDLTGEDTIVVFNGKGENGLNGSTYVNALVDSGLAEGLRFSVKWASIGSQHMYHMLTVQEIKSGRVYYYQPNVSKDIIGPDGRQYHGNGIESISVDEFKKIVCATYVPESVRQQCKIIKEVEDPSYAMAARGELQSSEFINTTDGNNIIKPFLFGLDPNRISSNLADVIRDTIEKIKKDSKLAV
jgi:hypothetical protein